MAAAFIAIDIICARFLSWLMPSGIDRISLQFVPNSMSGALMGPVWSMIVCAVADVLGMFINSAGKAYLPLLTLSAAVRGVIYGVMLYGKKATIWRAVVSVAIVTVVVELCMNSLWLAQMMGTDWLAIFVAKLPTRLITIPVYGGILYMVWKGLESAGLTEKR